MEFVYETLLAIGFSIALLSIIGFAFRYGIKKRDAKCVENEI